MYDIRVSDENFELFLEVVEKFNIFENKHLILAIKKNIPDGYPLDNLSIELVEALQKLNRQEIYNNGTYDKIDQRLDEFMSKNKVEKPN